MRINCIDKYKRLILVLSLYEIFSVSLIIEKSVMLIQCLLQLPQHSCLCNGWQWSWNYESEVTSIFICFQFQM